MAVISRMTPTRGVAPAHHAAGRDNKSRSASWMLNGLANVTLCYIVLTERNVLGWGST